jgi:hypothetical protein
MVPYGSKKRKSGKLHPHNTCGVCEEQIVNKKRARRKAKEQIKQDIGT